MPNVNLRFSYCILNFRCKLTKFNVYYIDVIQCLMWISGFHIAYSISNVSWLTRFGVYTKSCSMSCCSVLQCVAVCCSVLQCVAVYSMSHMNAVTRYKTSCSFSDVSWVTQFPVQNELLNFRRRLSVAECCRVLQCVAVCCSVLQCVAVCCTFTKRVARFPM